MYALEKARCFVIPIEEIWTERYRPKRLKDIIGQEHIIKRLTSFVETKSLPHCLFAGPAGCGKTTTALCIAHELYGDKIRGRFLELNASVTPDTPIMVKINGNLKRTNFAELDKIYFTGKEERIPTNNLEVLSMDGNYKVRFMPANYLFRHKKSKIGIVRFEGGIVKTSLDHSVFTLTEDGSLISRKIEDMKPGDFLITFKTSLEGTSNSVDVQDIKPKEFNNLRSGKIKNPKIRTSFDEFDLNEDFSRFLGLYMAEGCTSLSKKDTGGQTIFTLAYPKEVELASQVKNLAENMGMSASTLLGKSGFDRSKESSLQVRIFNTQLTKFMRDNFYTGIVRRAHTKKVPYFLYSAPIDSRIAFLKGYFEGDGSGKWDAVARLSSVSQECLIDVAWLGRMTNLETSCFEREARIIWKNPKFSYVKSDLVPAELLQLLNKKNELEKTYELRHSLYGKKSSRISKLIASNMLKNIDSGSKILRNIKKFIDSDLSVVKIKSINIMNYDNYVYDVSVPGSNMFWGGTIPVLLHNSDERGIDVIREKVKEFARQPAFDAGGLFRIVYLDEADALTKDAQHALRRTMENYSHICRFILACVSPDTKILLPEEVELTIDKFTQCNKSEVVSLDEIGNNLIERERVIAHIELDPKLLGKKTLRITTMSGRYLDLTSDHLILTDKGWKKSENINIGDKVAVFPHLEDTEAMVDFRTIISESNMEQLLNNYEGSYTKRHVNGLRYFNLTSPTRDKIKSRVIELSKILDTGLTAKEYNVYKVISSKKNISRKEIQEIANISRIRANELLKSLERKGYVKRVISGKINYFSVKQIDAHLLRNKVDIRRKVEEEFKINVSYKTIENIIKNPDQKPYTTKRILIELKKRGLVPLSYDNKKIGIISRLCGFLIGDGHITKNHQRLIFTGDATSLESIRKEIKELDFNPSIIYSKLVSNSINGRNFTGTTTWFYVDSRPLSLFFESLGIPCGDKITADFIVPEWVMNGPLFIKREFLRTLFGSEMDSPICYGKNFAAITFRQHKTLVLSKTAQTYGQQIVNLLKQFDVASKLKISKLPYTRKDGSDVCEIRIILDASNYNLYNFFRRIGYKYSNEKEKKGRHALEYLKHKIYTIKIQERIGEKIINEVNTGESLRSLSRKFGCSIDFVIHAKERKNVHLKRNFPTFVVWKNKFVTDDSNLVWNEVISMEDIELNKVMDLTCFKNHNFVANGIISHNCNYSAKIIPPIQSRTAVFRFASLKEADVIDYLRYIAKNEGLKVDEASYKAVMRVAEGDMRKATNILQTASTSKIITEDVIYSVTNRADPAAVKKMLETAIAGKFKDARAQLISLLNESGLSGEDLIKEIHSQIFEIDVSDRQKLEMIERTGEYEFRLTEGSNPHVQLEALLAQLALIGKR